MLNSLTPRRAFVLWFLVGTLVASVLQWSQSRVMGGVPEGLLFAGTWQEVHTLVVDQLPRTPVFEGYGHDGQIFYAIGLDLRGEWVPDILKSASYRYRRILYPALSSAFGALDGAGLLWGMILLANLPVGLAAGTVSLIVSHFRLSDRRRRFASWAPLAVVANPSAWLSARLLTADNLALALGLFGVLAFLKRRTWWAASALAAATLAKEPALAFAIGICAYAWFQREKSTAVRIAFGSGLPMVAWWGYVAAAIGNPLDSGGNVTAPFVGIAQSIPVWPYQSPQNWFYLSVAVAAFATATWILVRGEKLWRWILAPHLLVAVMSSHLVWHLGNNAMRAFGAIPILAVIGIAIGPRAKSLFSSSDLSLSPRP